MLIASGSPGEANEVLDAAGFAQAIEAGLEQGGLDEPQSSFAVRVVAVEGMYVAHEVPVPAGDWANERAFLQCRAVIDGPDVPEEGARLVLTAPLRATFPDDTGSLEELKTPRLVVFVPECVLEPESGAASAAIEEIALRHTEEAMRVGPTFTCTDLSACGALAQAIVVEAHGMHALGSADVSLVQPYQALRAAPRADRDALRAEAAAFGAQVERACRLPRRYSDLSPHGIPLVPADDAACIARAYAAQAETWTRRVRALGILDLIQETERDPKDHWLAQILLRQRGFLTAASRTDGSFGAGTRAAIAAAQSAAGLPVTGFMSDSTFAWLAGRTAPAGALAPADVAWRGFRWMTHSWQGFSHAVIENAHYRLDFACAFDGRLTVSIRRLDGQPAVPGEGLRMQIVSEAGMAAFSARDGRAEAVGSLGTAQFERALVLAEEAVEGIAVEIPAAAFETRFASLGAREAVSDFREMCREGRIP